MIIYGKQVVLYILDRHSKIINEVFLTKQIDKKLFNKFNKDKKEKIGSLEYLLKFLDAYDFGSDEKARTRPAQGITTRKNGKSQ